MNNNYANQSEIFTLLDGLISEFNRAINEFKTQNKPNVDCNESKPTHNSEYDNELLQLDKNLTIDIDVVDKHLTDTIVAINDATNQKNLLETKIADLEAEKSRLTIKLNELKEERENVHKYWISIHPAGSITSMQKTSPNYTTNNKKKMTVTSIFKDHLWNKFSDYAENDFPHLYWRFYSLVSGKTSSAKMFDRTFTFDDVVDLLKNAKEYDAINFLNEVRNK